MSPCVDGWDRASHCVLIKHEIDVKDDCFIIHDAVCIKVLNDTFIHFLWVRRIKLSHTFRNPFYTDSLAPVIYNEKTGGLKSCNMLNNP